MSFVSYGFGGLMGRWLDAVHERVRGDPLRSDVAGGHDGGAPPTLRVREEPTHKDTTDIRHTVVPSRAGVGVDVAAYSPPGVTLDGARAEAALHREAASVKAWIRKHHCLQATNRVDAGCDAIDMLLTAISECRAGIRVDGDGSVIYHTVMPDDPAIAAVHGHGRLLRELFSNLRGRRCVIDGCYSLAAPGDYLVCKEHHAPLSDAGTATGACAPDTSRRDLPPITPINQRVAD
jgi:hypothetical protein